MKYRLIAFDLDGTLTNPEGIVPDDARLAVQHAIAKGIRVTLATGRMYRPSARFARELGIAEPIICYQGALIAEPAGHRVLWHKPLPLSLARQAIETVRAMGVQTIVYVDDELYVERATERVELYAQRNGVKLNVVGDLVAAIEEQPTKIAAWGEPPEIDALAARLNAHFGSTLLVTKTFPTFCELGHPESGKGNALKYLAGLLGIGQGETVAVGNGPNDVDMLEWAGVGIAIGTAPTEVSAVADWVVDLQAGESLVQMVDRIVET